MYGLSLILWNIVTLMTKDLRQFGWSLFLFNHMWTSLIETLVTCYLLYNKTGFSSSAGIAILFLFIPVQIYCSRLIKKMRWKLNKQTDERIQITQETLSTIKIIKMYTWEKIFGEKINEARVKEMKCLFVNNATKLVLTLATLLVGKFGFYALIMVYLWMNADMNAETLFYVMRCFGTLRWSLSMAVSMGFTKIAELRATLSRLDTFLQQEELEVSVDKPDDEPQIDLRNVSLSFDDKKVLENVNLKMEAGLTVLTGQLGSGKSAFLKVALKAYPVEEGEVRTRGRKSYASQDPWLFPATIKQNILFGEKYDPERYKKVIDCCALQYDFNILEKGDETVVSDRGLNLSKGQQARVNLARAVYRESDIYLIDDSLTALDSAVQDQIFTDCIQGYLKDKLVVLVTHSPKHIEEADKVVIMENGRIKMERNQGEISKEILASLEEEFKTEEDSKKQSEEEFEEEATEKSKLLTAVPKRKAIYHENKKEGNVEFSVILNYFKSGGGIFFILLIAFSYVGSTFSDTTSQKMIADWINQRQDIIDYKSKYMENISFPAEQFNHTADNDTWLNYEKLEHKSSKTLNIYSILMVTSSLLELTKHLLILKFTVQASKVIHSKMVKSIIYTGMSFFDNFFLGNILNRFSQDLTIMDEVLPHALERLIGSMFHLFGVLGLIAAIDWKYIFPALILTVFMIILRYIYIPTARSLGRLEAATRSPLIGHLNSTLEGLTTIRAFHAQDILKREFDKHQDLQTSAHYTALIIRRAFSFFMDFFSVSFTIYIIVNFFLKDSSEINSGNVGLTINQIGNLTMIFQHGLIHWSEVETLMTSVERVSEYSNLEKELTSDTKPEHWPKKGEVKYSNVSMSYSHEKVLKGVSFTVKPKEKIGIVGRTGAGKTTILSTLFRLYDYEGDIFIDDIEIKSVALEYLRQNISIIPQDPVMFSGTIRSNIDPFQQHSDEDIWKTLHKIHMDSVISSIDEPLENMNFSTGQRQLICLARAIVKKCKIVVLDEATANMDPEADKMTQKIIMDNFHHCTMFIIAHRLESILECDKVLVMEKGEIKEFEAPSVLLADKNSMFSTMMRNAGLDNEVSEKP